MEFAEALGGEVPENSFQPSSNFQMPSSKSLELVNWNFLGNCGLELVFVVDN
jgi:hypothetical protein